jgi:hypothetical protein
MNETLPSISPPDLASIIGTAGAPIVIDVRSAAEQPRLILRHFWANDDAIKLAKMK